MWTIEDLRSKNGTSVSGKPVRAKTSLMDGQLVQIGPVSLIYRSSAAGLSTEVIPIQGQAFSPGHDNGNER